MSFDTIKVVNNKFITKINILKKMDIDNKFVGEIGEIEDSYNLNMIFIENLISFTSLFLSNQYEIKISGIYDKICQYYKYGEENENRISYNLIKIIIQQPISLYDICIECGEKMYVHHENSVLICSNCGYTKLLQGTIYEENQYVDQESTQIKSKGYKEKLHLEEWITYIEAKNDYFEFDPEKFQIVIKTIDQMYKNSTKIPKCEDYRSILKELGYSDWNKHIPALRYKHMGYAPPQLTKREKDIIIQDFCKNIDIYQRIKPNAKSSSYYYGYHLYKSIYNTIKNIDKRNRLLECIHLQSSRTIIEDDRLYKKICEERKNDGDMSCEYTPTEWIVFDF
jgi:DNA-directed RNA polymerase subunit M/transcription elongation factor TFIIS